MQKLLPKEDLHSLRGGDLVSIKGRSVEIQSCGKTHFITKPTFIDYDDKESSIYSFTFDGDIPVYKLVNKQQEIKDMTQPKQFTKADLKTGMRVVLRSGDEYVVIKDLYHSYFGYEKGNTILIDVTGNSWRNLKDYDDNLAHKDSSTEGIIKVYTIGIVTDILKPNPRSIAVIWEAPPLETPEEIEHNKLMKQITELQAQAEKLKPKK